MRAAEASIPVSVIGASRPSWWIVIHLMGTIILFRSLASGVPRAQRVRGITPSTALAFGSGATLVEVDPAAADSVATRGSGPFGRTGSGQMGSGTRKVLVVVGAVVQAAKRPIPIKRIDRRATLDAAPSATKS